MLAELIGRRCSLSFFRSTFSNFLEVPWFFSDHPHPHLNFISSNEGPLRGIATPGFTLDHPWPYQAMGYGRSTALAHILLYWNTWGTLNWTGCCFLCACGLFIFLYEFFSTPVRRKNRSWTTCGTLVRVNDYSKSCRIFRVHEKCNGRRTARGVTVITHWYNMGITNRGPINIIFSNCNKNLHGNTYCNISLSLQ